MFTNAVIYIWTSNMWSSVVLITLFNSQEKYFQKALGILIGGQTKLCFIVRMSHCQSPQKESRALILRLVEEDLQVLIALQFSQFSDGTTYDQAVLPVGEEL